MSRLIIVSNRVPKAGAPSTGGLAVGLRAALEAEGGIWMGWSGKTCTDDTEPALTTHTTGPITWVLSDLTNRDVTEYYQGFANSALWPLFHYRLGLTEFARADSAGYHRVNALFADRLLRLSTADDLIWVHDYHLLPLGAALRAGGCAGRIGYFHHIPWPSPDVFMALPGAEKLLKAMTFYSLIGFQTPADAANFEACLRHALPIARRGPDFICGAQRFQIGTFPISIDTNGFARRAAQAAEEPVLRRLRAGLGAQRLIVGVDRLDYTKGIPERIGGFRRYLCDNPDAIGKVAFLQIAPRSRSDVTQYEALEREIATLAGQMAGEWNRLDWTPLRYVNRAFGQNVLAGLFRQADLGLVTPLRDGMNLVAKEFVAAQNPENPGVLVLSRFAGAADELGCGALVVNPYDQEAIALAISQALAMPLAERRARHDRMMTVLRQHTIFDWCRSYLDALAGAPCDLQKLPA